MSTLLQKKELRRAILRCLRAIPGAERDAASARLRHRLAPLLEGNPKNVAIYAAMPHEVDLLPLVREYPQHRFCFPRCENNRSMNFHIVTSPEEELQPGAYGILTPDTSCEILPPEQLDVIIVPGVAFTEAGERLGYGGGYYDTYLPRCCHATIAAAAFHQQMVPYLPTEAHDLRIPHIFTL